jgi:hypothetical protein
MIELFPAKCRDEILRCGHSVWVGIIMKHYNTPTKRATSLVSFCVHPKASSKPSMNTVSENEVYQTISWRSDREICGKCRESDEMVNRLFHSTHQSSLTIEGRPLRGSSCTFSRPSLKCLTHLLTIEALMACYPYTSQSWRWMSACFMFLAFQKRITDCISHAAVFSVFLKILNTQDDA